MTRPGVAPARPSGGALRRRLGPTRAAFGGLFVVMGLNMFAIGVTLPVVPRYVEGPLGEGGLAVGLVTGAFAATGIACRPLAGHLADRRGRRRAVLFGCLLASCACGLHFLPFGVGGLVFARLCLGAGQGTVYTASSAWVVDLSPPDQRGRLIGLYGLAVWGGLAVGAPIGEWTLRAGDYEAVWALALTAPLIGAAITTRLPEPGAARAGLWGGVGRAGPALLIGLRPRSSSNPGASAARRACGRARGGLAVRAPRAAGRRRERRGARSARPGPADTGAASP